jgi:hypothetical protein
MKKIDIPALGKLAIIADVLMTPLMYLLSGTLKEAPQGGHRWNNKKLQPKDVRHLFANQMVYRNGLITNISRCLFLYHIPILGGWRDYVVLIPELRGTYWHVGWITNDSIGISQVRLLGPVRMLIGPDDVFFFGISVLEHGQIGIKEIGRGRIGDHGPYSKIPLL